MKLARFGIPGREKPGLTDTQGRLQDLSKYLADITLSHSPTNNSKRSPQSISISCLSKTEMSTSDHQLREWGKLSV